MQLLFIVKTVTFRPTFWALLVEENSLLDCEIFSLEKFQKTFHISAAAKQLLPNKTVSLFSVLHRQLMEEVVLILLLIITIHLRYIKIKFYVIHSLIHPTLRLQ